MYSFPYFEPYFEQWNHCSISSSNHCFLTCLQFSQQTGKWSGILISFKNFPQFVAIHTVKSFSVVNEVEVDVCLKSPCFLHDPMNVGSLISDSSAFKKPSLHICKIVWMFFGIVLIWVQNEKLIFFSPGITAEFSKFAGILRAALQKDHLLGFEIAQLEFHHLH